MFLRRKSGAAEDSETEDSTPRRFRRMRYGPLRLVLPWLAIVAGITMSIGGGLRLGATGDGDPLFLLLGASLVLVGIAAYFLYRWMANRRI